MNNFTNRFEQAHRVRGSFHLERSAASVNFNKSMGVE